MHFDFSKEDFQTSKTISPGGRARAGGAQWPLEERSDSGSPRLKVPRGDSGGGWYRRKPAQAALGPSDPGKAGICRKRQLLQVHPCRPQALPAWTTSQALQPLRNPQGGTPGPAEVPRGGWRVRPLGGRRAEVGATWKGDRWGEILGDRQNALPVPSSCPPTPGSTSRKPCR